MKTALVIGVSGHDGAYLAKLLLEKGYKVSGTSRDAHIASFRNLERPKIREEIRSKAASKLAWTAGYQMDDVARMMVEAEES